jgi:hypothetical protein
MAGRKANDDAVGPAEVAAYVASMAHELKEMAERQQFKALAYLLELARMEAEARAADAERSGGRR